MEKLLIRTFIKDYEKIEDNQVRYTYGRLSGIIGIIVNLLVCFGELLVGFLIGSIAMISDGIHNVADAGGSLISLLSFKLSNMKADEEHPYGHGRAEYLFSIAFAVILFVVAIQLGKESVERILSPEPVTFSIVAFVVMLVAMCLKLWLSLFLRSIGKAINSPILVANGMESLSDVGATGAIALGLLVGYFFDISIDGYLGLLVACLIAKAGFHVFKESTSSILGNEPSKERAKEVIDFVRSYPGVLGTHNLMIHDYGPGNEFASIDVEMNAKMDMIQAHTLVDQIEHDAKEQLGIVLTTHMDPLVQDEETKTWAEKIQEIVTAYDKEFEVHDVRIFKDGSQNTLNFTLIIPFSRWSQRDEIVDFFKVCVHTLDPTFIANIQTTNNYASIDE